MLYACGWQEPDSIPSNVVIRNKKKDKHDQAAGCGAGAGKFRVCCIFSWFFQPHFLFDPDFQFRPITGMDLNQKWAPTGSRWQKPDSISSNVMMRNKKKDKNDHAAGYRAGAGKFGVCCSFGWFFWTRLPVWAQLLVWAHFRSEPTSSLGPLPVGPTAGFGLDRKLPPYSNEIIYVCFIVVFNYW